MMTLREFAEKRGYDPSKFFEYVRHLTVYGPGGERIPTLQSYPELLDNEVQSVESHFFLNSKERFEERCETFAITLYEKGFEYYKD